VSIFTRDCPVCAASHPVHAVRCGCGYCFDPGKVDGVTQELEVISQEEQLYRDYLAARAAQAQDAAQVAKAAAKRDPGNTVKAAEALLANQTAMNARAELEAQDARAVAVKNRITVVRSRRRGKSKTAAPVSHPTPNLPAVREVLAPPVAAAPQLAKPMPKPAAIIPTPIRTAAKQPAPTRPSVVLPVNAPTPAIAKPMQAPKPPSIPVLTQVNAREPSPAFRSTQAAKAEQIAAPTPAKPTSQDCPNCYAKVAANSKRCRCGYELPVTASQMPGLAMSPEDRAAMLTALGLNRDTGS
jgi:hypothetical protein